MYNIEIQKSYSLFHQILVVAYFHFLLNIYKNGAILFFDHVFISPHHPLKCGGIFLCIFGDGPFDK